jgi:AhpC/TSA family
MSTSSSPASRSYRAARQAQAALSRASRRAIMTAAVALGATFLMNAQALATPAVGQPAPDFVALDTAGTAHRLSDFAGRFVVLEWTNPACPVVGEHYDDGTLPATQKSATARGVVWLAINSTGRNTDDYRKPPAVEAWMRARSAAVSAVLMDEDGVIGRAYGARATPQIFIVDPQGTLVYAGGIDRVASPPGGKRRMAGNYVDQALGEAFGGRPITMASSRVHGSPIRYQA